jgi:hypothetical protein
VLVGDVPMLQTRIHGVLNKSLRIVQVFSVPSFSTILRRMLNKYPSRLTPNKWFFVSLKPALFAKKDWICKNFVCQYLNGSCALDCFLAVGTKKRKNHQGEDIIVSSTIRRQKRISLISE